MRSLLDLDDLDVPTIEALLSRAAEHSVEGSSGERTEKTLSGVTVSNLFFEPSTRTQLSFDLAAQRCGADVLNFNEIGSSTSKGESLQDTVQTIAAIGSDVLVVRHEEPGTQARVALWTAKSVVNAGEGTIAHPTQALLDAATLLRRFGRISGLRVGIVGDVAHSRVASSLLRLLPRLGATVFQIGPGNLMNDDTPVEALGNLDDVIGDLDVVYLLRVQRERGAEIPDDYIDRYQLNRNRVEQMKPEAVVMHPGPVNRGVEIESSILEEERSLVLDQVAAGVPVRMAVLEWVLGR